MKKFTVTKNAKISENFELESGDIIYLKESDNNTVEVVFRKWEDGEVIALFPNEDEGRGMILSYMHMGQHSSADSEFIDDLEVASPREYASLKNELENQVGYNLIVLP